MKFALVISAAPEADLQPVQFAMALLAEGHTLTRVFFLREGVRHGEAGSPAAAAWLSLAGAGQMYELALCISATERRHLQPVEHTAHHVGQSAARFEVMGLGQLVDALEAADRVIDFPG